MPSAGRSTARMRTRFTPVVSLAGTTCRSTVSGGGTSALFESSIRAESSTCAESSIRTGRTGLVAGPLAVTPTLAGDLRKMAGAGLSWADTVATATRSELKASARAKFGLLIEVPAFMVALATAIGGPSLRPRAIGITLKLVHRESCLCELNFSAVVAIPAKKFIGRATADSVPQPNSLLCRLG